MSTCRCVAATLYKFRGGPVNRPCAANTKAHSRAGIKRICGTKHVKRVVFCRSQSEPDKEDVGGDKNVQEALLESLRLGIKRQQTKDEVEESFQQEVQKLREIADQAKEELEQVAKLNQMRQDLAFGSTLADLLSDVDQMQDEIRKSREQTEADQREFEQWERDTNIARSQGLFFQSLYPVKPKGADSGSTPSTSGTESSELSAALRSQAAASTRQSIQEVTKEQLAAPWRLYLLSYMILILLLFATYDLLGPLSSPLQDGGLILLSALMSLAAWNERQAVIALTHPTHQIPDNSGSSPPTQGGASKSETSKDEPAS